MATQNPVDLDYKALSNAGTWFLGRLQTARDVDRMLDGLEGASSAAGKKFDAAKVRSLLGGLDSRVFLMNNVHEDEPILFHTRWALSYLAGPLTRPQIGALMADRKSGASTAASPAKAAQAGQAAATSEELPLTEEGVAVCFVEDGATSGAQYVPALHARAQLHYANAKKGIDEWTERTVLVPLGEGARSPSWDDWTISTERLSLVDAPANNARFGELPKVASKKESYPRWEKTLKTKLYQSQAIELFSHTPTKLHSEPGESRAAFMGRVQLALRERRDDDIESLRKKYAPKLARLEERIHKADEKVAREEAQ
ncbi:MAG: hypothetical protein KC492_06370, partial [Myxococcales bacterium]|nr:hypothetical protein [Myxococcales bacterium]